MLDPSSRYFYSLISNESFSDPAKSTIESLEVTIGFDASRGLHSIETWITAWDQEEN